MSREHRFRVARGKLFAGVGGARLDKDRAALRRARNVQRTEHRKMRPLMIDGPYPRAIGVSPARAVVEHGVIGPAVPQAFDHRHELLGPLVAIGMADLSDM